MSYTRHFSKDITIPVEVKLRDPKCSAKDNSLDGSYGEVVVKVGDRTYPYSLGYHGSSHGDSWKVTEVVNVNIEVDTEQYDKNVDGCVNSVQLLTGSVAATEAAQVKSIYDNTRLVAGTIVKGFFKNVQSEISSQIMELSHRVESKLMHLAEQAKELKKKREQMENDYRRTANRYAKIIEDLNKELENRVVALDQPIYKLHETLQHESNRLLDSDCIEISSIVSQENGILESQIQAAIIKDRTRELIDQTKNLLALQKGSERVIRNSTVLADNDATQYYLPLLFYEEVEGKGRCTQSCVYDTEKILGDVKDHTDNLLLDDPNGQFAFDEKQKEAMRPYITNEVDEAFAERVSPRDDRIKEMIFKLLNN